MLSVTALARDLAQVRASIPAPSDNPLLDQLRADPAGLLAGAQPDQWQLDLLQSPTPATLLNCARQSGKSTISAGLALQAAMFEAPALVLLLSPTLRQSAELFLKVLQLYRGLGRPVPTAQPRDNVLRIELANGSRIISLPGTETTVRGYSSAALIVIDEAARVDDALYFAVRPMLAVSGGRLVCLSTPYGKRGWYYREWTEGEGWHRVQIDAWHCPRITRQFLERERQVIGERWFRQEYECSFEETLDAVFAQTDVAAILTDGIEPIEV